MIYTIGYGSRSLEQFLELLLRYEIGLLVDVRSQPYSRFKPEFSSQALQASVHGQGLRYAWLGDTLGGRPGDVTCYTDGRVDYALCRERAWFRDGIDHLLRLCTECRGAVMCAESRPEACHRTRLIGETLAAAGMEVLHIDHEGALQAHSQVIALLDGAQPDLFGGEYRSYTSRKRFVPSPDP